MQTDTDTAKRKLIVKVHGHEGMWPVTPLYFNKKLFTSSTVKTNLKNILQNWLQGDFIHTSKSL